MTNKEKIICAITGGDCLMPTCKNECGVDIKPCGVSCDVGRDWLKENDGQEKLIGGDKNV